MYVYIYTYKSCLSCICIYKAATTRPNWNTNPPCCVSIGRTFPASSKLRQA